MCIRDSLQDVRLGIAAALRDLPRGRGAHELLGEGLARQGDLLHALADGARHADDPRPIPKIVLDHARHGGHGKGGKLNALVAGEALQGPDQGHGRDLLQVVVFDAAARVLARDHVGKVHVLLSLIHICRNVS